MKHFRIAPLRSCDSFFELTLFWKLDDYKLTIFFIAFKYGVSIDIIKNAK